MVYSYIETYTGTSTHTHTHANKARLVKYEMIVNVLSFCNFTLALNYTFVWYPLSTIAIHITSIINTYILCRKNPMKWFQNFPFRKFAKLKTNAHFVSVRNPSISVHITVRVSQRNTFNAHNSMQLWKTENMKFLLVKWMIKNGIFLNGFSLRNLCET